MSLKQEEDVQVMAQDAPEQPLSGPKAGTADDRRDMTRMGKRQQLRRDFSFIPIFSFAMVLMITWEVNLSVAGYALPNGGRPALIWPYVVSVFGFGAAILSMAEMASMAPTSGGQYHWCASSIENCVVCLLSDL